MFPDQVIQVPYISVKRKVDEIDEGQVVGSIRTGVPLPAVLCWIVAKTLAMPKSDNFARLSWAIKIFSGLRSLEIHVRQIFLH